MLEGPEAQRPRGGYPTGHQDTGEVAVLGIQASDSGPLWVTKGTLVGSPVWGPTDWRQSQPCHFRAPSPGLWAPGSLKLLNREKQQHLPLGK